MESKIVTARFDRKAFETDLRNLCNRHGVTLSGLRNTDEIGILVEQVSGIAPIENEQPWSELEYDSDFVFYGD
tara:strand:+ start:1203 stop:1421 length:219 start_codon:yes stop_codon:yes gene_type:complete